MPRQPKKERLNIFLLKSGISRQHAIRPDAGNLMSFPISEEFDFEGEIKVKVSHASPPGWKRFVESGTHEDLPDLATQSAGALAVITVEDRIFCVSWGNGRHWIDEKNIERRFGMIVTLNTVDPKLIRSVDREEFETVTRMTRSQLSVASSIDSFGLDVQRDLVRSVTGTPEDPAFAAHVTGADNLVLHTVSSFAQLGAKCGEALQHYREEKYKEVGFGWIDNFVRVRDRLLVTGLEESLVEALRTGADNVFLSPPIFIESQDHLGFRLPGERKTSPLHSDLRLEEFFQRHDRASMTIDWLKDHKISEFAADGTQPSRKFSVLDALVYEVRIAGKLYVLSQGDWFEIDEEYVNEVNNELEQVPASQNLNLPDALSGEGEPEYNQRAAAGSLGQLALLDTPEARVRYGGGRSIIEICDLLSLDRNFVHVKSKTKSSALSHLFAQGTNSAQAFRDVRFRELAAAQCPVSHRSLFTAPDIRVTDYSVTFGIITRFEGDIKDALPFFSKQSLVNAFRILRNMGYQVYLKKIAIVDPSTGAAA